MRIQTKALKAIRNKSGISMTFVLAIMLFLTIIGASALVSASANAGSVLNSQFDNQLNIYADSMHKTINYSILASGTVPDESDTLRGQIINIVSEKVLENMESHTDKFDGGKFLSEFTFKADDFQLNMEPGGTGLPDLSFISISSKVSPKEVRAIPEVYEWDELAEDYVLSHPQTMKINGIVTITITLTDVHAKKSIITEASYSFKNSAFRDDGAGNMLIDNTGDWELILYDVADKF